MPRKRYTTTTRPDELGSESLLEAGFSVKLKSRRGTRLFFDELQRQRSGAQLPVREVQRERRARVDDPAVAVKRQPLLSQEDLDRQYTIELAQRGIDPRETERWPAAIQQTRVSRLEEGTSTAPIRHLEDGAKYMVDWKLRPVHLCHEEVAGSIFRKRRRRVFEEFYDDIEHDRIRDPLTGEPVRHIVCFHYDRFTREPGEGEKWIELLRRKGFGLYESAYGDEPRSVAKSEDKIREAWNNGAREVKRLRERVLNALERLAREGKPTYGADNLFGHIRATVPGSNPPKVVGYKAHPEQAAVICARARELIAGASIYSVQCWLNDNGYPNGRGNPWRHRSVEGLFRSPRLAGLVRLKTDTDRYFDDSYEGELFPGELIYGPGEAPDPDFDPPIEPILPYPMWAELQAALNERKRVRRRGHPPQRRLASGRLTCSECGGRMIGGMRGSSWIYRCPKRHLEGRTRTKADHLGKKAHDGLRHPTVNGATTDRLLEEIIFAAVDRDPDPADALPTIDIEAERKRLEGELRAIAEKVGDISHMLRHGRISRARYDEWCDELDGERNERRAQLTELDERHPVELLADGVTLRELWADMPLERRCQWLDIVFKRVVVKPASNLGGMNISSRFEFEFAEGYEPPARELDDLLRLVERRFRNEKGGSRITPELEDEMFQMHVDGRHLTEIAKILQARGVCGPGGGAYSRDRVTSVLKQACAERNVPYVTNRQRRRHEYPDETLELVLDLYRQIGGFAGTARELNRLGVPRPLAGDWEPKHVGYALNRYARLKGIDLKAEQQHSREAKSKAADALPETIWRLRYAEEKTLKEISDWLRRQGIKSPAGSDQWSLMTISRIAKRADEAKHSSAREMREAA